jgi:hypothetical protein
MNNVTHADPLTATLVPEDKRLRCLPAHFKREYLRVETTVFNFMSRMCDGYNGGYWAFYEVSNGAFFMAPSGEGNITLTSMNGRSYEVSKLAAGVVVMLFALSILSFDTQEDAIAEQFHLLRDYARSLPEGSKILSLID